MSRQEGLTLLELVTALAIVAILAALAVPALDTLRLNAGRAAAMDGLLRAAWFARSEAFRQGRPVMLCPATAGGNCAATRDAWGNGWLVVPVPAGGAPLRRGPGATHPGAGIRANRAAFVFEPGERRSTNGTLAWCDRRGDVAARSIIIAPTGRPRLERGPGSLECPGP